MELKDILPSNLDLTNGLHSSKKKNDICITIGFKTFLINQSILSVCSKYFHALMYSDTNKSKEMINLLIKGIDAHSFANVLYMITKGKNKITENNMLAMWRAAHHLKIEFLIEQCESFVNAHVTEEHYLNIYQHAIAFKSETAYKKVISLMIKNFDRLIKTDTFLTLTPKTLIEILTSGGIKWTQKAAERAISFQLENEKLVKLQLNAEEITPEAMSLSDLTIEDISSEVASASPQMQHVILFIDRNQSLLALNILSSTIRQVSFDIKGTFEDLYVLEHKLHILVSRSFVSLACQLRLYKISDFQSIICYFGSKNRTKFIINGTFHYAFLSCNKKITGTKRPDPYQRTWATIDYYHDIGEVTSLVNFENEIVGFFSGEEEGKEVTRIFSFNTTSRTFYPIVNLDGSAKNLAIFTFKKEAVCHPRLWDFDRII
ncbi:kelch-like protein 40 [Biomphalaria pfeifferi]|uniref:Kelch-like protein 40 n=1 Tax=Biomphalaria pfeifferi TaxID=112525 RepID=A0AAD8C4D1_BIOPF|nr:kelch-like protein 40 [Biomphalaria pfeifferi]